METRGERGFTRAYTIVLVLVNAGVDFCITQYNLDPTQTQPSLGWVLGQDSDLTLGLDLYL